jgi:hypothetical protein
MRNNESLSKAWVRETDSFRAPAPSRILSSTLAIRGGFAAAVRGQLGNLAEIARPLAKHLPFYAK